MIHFNDKFRVSKFDLLYKKLAVFLLIFVHFTFYLLKIKLNSMYKREVCVHSHFSFLPIQHKTLKNLDSQVIRKDIWRPPSLSELTPIIYIETLHMK